MSGKAARSPQAVCTLFELPVSEFGAATGEVEAELTASAVQALQLQLEQGENEAPADTADGGAAATAAAAPRGPTCIACAIGVAGAPGFSSPEEQRRHFSLDWHRYNVKRRAARQPPVSEAAFAALVEDERQEVGSISGSESEDSDEDNEEEVGERGAVQGPQFAFSTSDGKCYTCWRALVAPERDLQRASLAGSAAVAAGTAAAAPSAEQSLATLRTLRQHGGRWAVVMLRGGHFAAAVFNVDPARVANPRQPDKFEALAHKSAHRYVVRAGQGGKQSAKDASGKYARSAGSRLRRYNEAALQRDVAEALASWKELLESCSLIFVHAPSSNWQQLFGGEAPLLDKADSRIRRVPFTTRRPTFSETKRVMRILVTLYQLPQPAAAPEAAVAAGGEAEGQPAAAEAAAAAGSEGDVPAVERQLQQRAAATAAAAVAAEQEAATAAAAEAAAAAAAEEEARRKKAEKRARQKAKQKEARQAEAAASRAAAEEAARQAADDEIGRAAAAVAAMTGKLTAKPAPVSGGGGAGPKASGAAPAPRLSAKPRANESADVRRARLAAAAEARMKALQEAAKQQQLH